MSRRVVVVGSGIAGLAAAFAARRAKATVTMVMGRPGATTLTSGALDDIDWERADARPPRALEPSEKAFLDAFGIWEVGEERALVATSSGRLRSARGRDRAVLDLSRFGNAVIALPRMPRFDWDADALASTLSSEPLARARGLRFEAIDADVLRFADEARLSAAELAERHDAERVAWLIGRLRACADLAGKQALLVGPFLGLEPSVAEALTEALGMPVGETLSPVGGVAGLRFERARDRLLSKLDVVAQPGVSTGARGEAGRAIVELEGDAMLDGNIVVLATGGVAGGGMLLSRSMLAGLDEDSRREPAFLPSVDCEAVLFAGGRPLVLPSSPYGASAEDLAWSAVRGRTLLETVGFAEADGWGIRADGDAIDWLLVAGDAVADRPRTVLEAMRTGLRAGERAARGRG